MRHERFDHDFGNDLVLKLRTQSMKHDEDGSFPLEAFATLRSQGLIAHPPLVDEDAQKLLRLLALIGRGDLSVGRIFEGHVNALWLIQRYGSTSQKVRYNAIVKSGGLLGVWNTDDPNAPLQFDRLQLKGKKSFASGVDGLDWAIVTVDGDAGREMIVVPLDRQPVDRSWWKPTGMRASGSHVVDFSGMTVDSSWRLGSPGDYIKQPWFSAGAMRFAAVHAGGTHAVFDAAVEHLLRTKRADDPHQRHRIGRMAIAVETSYLWLDRAAQGWIDAAKAQAKPEFNRLIAIANAARTAIEAAAHVVLHEASRAVGSAAFIAPHPLEQLSRDLRTYLCQPNPDAALDKVGVSITLGQWTPGL